MFDWLTKDYRLRRKLEDDERKELQALAKTKGITAGDILLRTIIDETVGKHVSTKMRLKYAAVLEKALAEKVQSKNLRQFIEGYGGINRLAAGGEKKPILLNLRKPKLSPPFRRKFKGRRPRRLKLFRTQTT